MIFEIPLGNETRVPVVVGDLNYSSYTGLQKAASNTSCSLTSQQLVTFLRCAQQKNSCNNCTRKLTVLVNTCFKATFPSLLHCGIDLQIHFTRQIIIDIFSYLEYQCVPVYLLCFSCSKARSRPLCVTSVGTRPDLDMWRPLGSFQ